MEPVSPNGHPARGPAVLVVAEDDVTRLGLRLLLRNVPAVVEVVEAQGQAEGLRLARGPAIDAVVIDVCRPATRGRPYPLIDDIARARPDLRVLVCTDDVLAVGEHCRANRLNCVCLPRGANSAALLSEALVSTLAAAAPAATGVARVDWVLTIDPVISLTAKEREVLSLVASGGSSKEIAAALRVSLRTVESHRARICTKLGVRTVAGLTKVAIRAGLTSLAEGLPDGTPAPSPVPATTAASSMTRA